MTGRHPIRYGMMRGVVMGYHDYGLDPEATIVPQVLAAAGYEHRGLVGKWHLGLSRREYHPLERGFTRFVREHAGGGSPVARRRGERRRCRRRAAQLP